MKFVVDSNNKSTKVSLSALQLAGFWAPEEFCGFKLFLYHCLTFVSYMYFGGTFIIIQVVDMYQVWGDLALMTGTAYLLFTNLVHCTKIINILVRRSRIAAFIREADQVLSEVVDSEELEIVQSCDRETIVLQVIYVLITTVTAIGWSTSSEKNHLPLPRAWYPYDTSNSPAFEITFAHQVSAIFIAGYMNVAKDTLVAGLIAQNKCQLQLLNLKLGKIHEGMGLDEKSPAMLTVSQEKLALHRLCSCTKAHQRALRMTPELQECFSMPTFVQLAVSLVIICVSAFQLSQTRNLVRFLSMGTYLLNMTYQVFIYCYQGNQLREESLTTADRAYQCLWYRSSTKLRRSLLVLMVRARRPSVITVGNFTALSLSSFMAIVKASYSFFTVLQQVTQDQNGVLKV